MRWPYNLEPFKWGYYYNIPLARSSTIQEIRPLRPISECHFLLVSNAGDSRTETPRPGQSTKWPVFQAPGCGRYGAPSRRQLNLPSTRPRFAQEIIGRLGFSPTTADPEFCSQLESNPGPRGKEFEALPAAPHGDLLLQDSPINKHSIPLAVLALGGARWRVVLWATKKLECSVPSIKVTNVQQLSSLCQCQDIAPMYLPDGFAWHLGKCLLMYTSRCLVTCQGLPR